jgi:hypothetical protein
VRGAVANPCTHDEPHPDHLLGKTNDEATIFRVCQLRLVHRHCHTHDPDRPARDDPSNQQHCHMHSRRLKDGTDYAHKGTKLDASASPETVNG